MKFKYSIALLVVAAAVAVVVSGASVSENETSPKKGVRAGFSPAKLFDFENYKTVFHKTYSGFLEEMVRAKYFLSRAFRAFVSAIKYKYRKSSYYLAVNQRSDWTPEELDRSKNRVLAGAHGGKTRKTRSIKEDDLPEFLPNNVEDFKRELKKIADSAPPGSPGYEELKAAMGETVSMPSNANVRNLPWTKLINNGARVHLNAKAARKVDKDPESNNPAYKHLELPSFGLVDEQKYLDPWTAESTSEDETSDGRAEAIGEILDGISEESQQAVAEKVELPDEVFADLRNTSCFTVPRDQGDCGACWALAATSIFEWLHCRITNKLVEFSEQYMVDCGNKYVENIYGCEGGDGLESAHFVKNFGVELRKHYPYNERDNECPFQESTNLNETGFIRFDFDEVTKVPVSELAPYLDGGPIWIGIAEASGLSEYGGGVFNKEFYGLTDHAVVLVGHGRKDGEEYWIIRNSYGPGWGEGGYARIAKSTGCFQTELGFLFASDGDNILAKVEENKLYGHRIVEGRLKEEKSSYGEVDITELF